MKLLIFILYFGLASCSHIGVGGSISGGSNSGVNVGTGVNIHLYTESTVGTN